jgi:hypothetical protein
MRKPANGSQLQESSDDRDDDRPVGPDGLDAVRAASDPAATEARH